MLETLRIGELFCGAGGIGIGAKISAKDTNATIKHVWATDYNQDACNTYKHNLECEHVICKDIRKLDLSSLQNKGNINCLTFGFPCNDFSTVGEQKGLNGSFGALYEYCVKALKIFHPDYFIAENVSGLKNANDGKAFSLILKSFENEGYQLHTNLFKFEEYGIPQKRHRIIIVGIKNSIKSNFTFPEKSLYNTIDNTVQTALSNIKKTVANQERTKQSPTVVERLKHIKPGENAFTATLPDHLKLNVKGAKISQIYKRLKANEPAYTITGSGGGGTHVYHYDEPRALTNRERARLQTFPDDFVFQGSKESVRKQIGMAVPPRGAKIIFDALINSIIKRTQL